MENDNENEYERNKQAFTLSAKERNNLAVILPLVVIGVAALIQIICFFPVLKYKGKNIRMFALAPASEVISGDYPIDGYVLFNYTLETEYGEIKLKSGCQISGVEHSISSISDGSFKTKQAVHNLVVEGIKMPENIEVIFFVSKFFHSKYRHQIARLNLDNQEIMVSGIPLGVDYLSLRQTSTDDPADIEFGVNYLPEIITLADSTQIMFDPLRGFLGGLSFYLEDEQWRLWNMYDPFPVKLPGESEFEQYGSITFKKDWGEFVEGEKWQEKPRENTRERLEFIKNNL